MFDKRWVQLSVNEIRDYSTRNNVSEEESLRDYLITEPYALADAKTLNAALNNPISEQEIVNLSASLSDLEQFHACDLA